MRRVAVLLCCIFGLAGTGCAAAFVGAAGAHVLAQGFERIAKSGPTIDTTYAADVPTVAALVSQVVTDHTAESQFALTRNTTKDDANDREIELRSAQGSWLTLRVQGANENGATAARLRISGHIERSIKLIGATRKDMGAEDEFREIINKVRQSAVDRKLKVLRDTRATDSS